MKQQKELENRKFYQFLSLECGATKKRIKSKSVFGGYNVEQQKEKGNTKSESMFRC